MPDKSEWRFPPVRKDQPFTDPVQDEFFTTESVGGIAEALVREAVQNSLDARARRDRPARVVFNLAGMANPLHVGRGRAYFSGLARHLTAKKSGVRNVPSLTGRIPYMTIEDFGTSGLGGDPDEHDVDEDDGGDHDFYWFWRNVGRSGKSKEALGRWGLGKTVFPASSCINTFFGLSFRAGSSVGSLMGQCVLKTHRDSDAVPKCSPYGYFARFDDTPDNVHFARPLQQSGDLTSFAECFELGRRSRPGLSIVIPFPHGDLSTHGITLAVARQWFYPVLCGHLEVEITDGTTRCLLSGTDFDETLENLAADDESGDVLSVKRMYNLASWGRALEADAHTVLAPHSEGAPRWADVSVPEAELKGLQQEFEAGKRLAFRVWLRCQEVGENPTNSYFDLYVERDDTLQRCQDCFVRAGVTIANIRSRITRPVRALVVVEHEHLRNLLGDAENPAHTEWHKDSLKFRGKYVNGPSILDFVRNSVREVSNLLTPVAEGTDESLLGDIFFLEDEHSTPDAGPDSEGGPDSEDDVFVETGTATPSSFLVKRIAGGIRIVCNGHHKGAVEGGLVRLAYVVRGANPFRRYHPLDFELNDPSISVVCEGGNVMSAALNEIRFAVADTAGFGLTVTGFDPARDLKVLVESTMEDA